MSVMTPRHTPVRCRILRRHRWTTASTEDGGRYRVCTLCGHEWSGDHFPGALGGGFGAPFGDGFRAY